ncbi:MAG: hypothetical protein ACYDEX_15730 [Mobilitalea sp.]
MLINDLLDKSEEWLQYAIRLNILNEKNEDLIELKHKVLKNDKIKSYLYDITDYHKILVSNHKNPMLPIYKLMFLLDIGLDCSVPEIQIAINEIMKHKDNNGVYQSLTNIPKHFGGSGEDTFGWCLCDAPLLLLALIKAGIDYEEHVKKGVNFLGSLLDDNGFPCVVSSELGKFRGPGRKDDCCPYATLIMLNLLLHVPENKYNDIINNLANKLLTLWENSLDKHPYMFYMGTDFRKLKAPSIWYDIVSVVNVLSKCESIRNDKRYIEMLSIIQSKQGEDGFFTPESIYQKFKGWDFGQKKNPSPYLTYLCMKSLEQI